MTIKRKQAPDKGMIYREASIDGIKDAEKRIVEVSFSSEQAVRDWHDTLNVLGHKPGEVDLKRINNAGPVLLNHDIAQHVGGVVRAWLDEKGKKCRAEIKIARTKEGDEVWSKIEDEILKGISVGACVLERKLVSEKDGLRTVRSTKWEPVEISLTPIPADLNVGVGRIFMDDEETTQTAETDNAPPATGGAPSAGGDTSAVQRTQQTETSPVSTVAEPARRELTSNEVREITRMGIEYGFSREALDSIERGERPNQFAERCLRLAQGRSAENQVPANQDSTLNLNKGEVNRFSLAKLVRARAFPNNKRYQDEATFEIECVRAMGSEEGNTLAIPAQVMRSWGVNRANPIGANPGNLDAFVQENPNFNLFVESLRAESEVLKQVTILSGLKGRHSFPIGKKNSQVGWVGINAPLPETDVDTGKNEITPKKVGGIFKIQESALLFASVATEQMLRKNITEAMAEAMSKVIFYGSGAGDEPMGLLNTTGINKVQFASNYPTHQELTQLYVQIRRKLAAKGKMTYHFSATMEDHLLITPRANGTQGPILTSYGEPLIGREYEATELIDEGHIFFGNFAEVMVGIWDQFQIEINPYSSGWNANEIAMKAYQIAGLAVRRPEAFAFGSM